LPDDRRGVTRWGASIGVALAVALGLSSRLLPLGLSAWDKSAGDVAYALLIGFVAVCLRPRARPRTIGAVTAAVCFAVELFQLTGLPRRAPGLVRAALGDTFAWHDVACYLIGAAIVTLLHARATRASAKREEGDERASHRGA
jgi:hypothetical protein